MTGDRSRIGKFLEWLETAPRGAGWFILLCGWIFARNFLEGILERPNQLGFDWREEISFPMMFLHFPIYYLALFAGICLWLHLVTRRPLSRIVRVVAMGYAVLLLAPVIDAIKAPGAGYDLRYLLGFGSVLWRFWDPRTQLAEVSPGQRVEIALACMLAFSYTGFAHSSTGRNKGPAAARTLAKAALAAAGVYFLAAFLGAWPSLFARITCPGSATMEAAYQRVFQQGGLISGESRRLTQVMLLPLFALLVWLLRRAHPVRSRDLARHLGWTRLIFYTGLTPAGAYLGYVIYREHLQIAYTNPSDFAATFILWSAMTAAYVASCLLNDVHDRDADRINAPHRPIAAGRWLEEEARRTAGIFALVAIFLALCVSYFAALFITACLFLSWCYSAPPLRCKRWPILATFVLGLTAICSALTGFSLFGQEMTPLVFPRPVALCLLFGVTFAFTAKDLKDHRGDRATGVVTLATLLPDRPARLVIASLVAFSYLLSAILLPLGGLFVAISVAFALTSGVLCLRVRRPDSDLLIAFILFAALLLGFLSRNPRILQEGPAADLTRTHARILTLEEQARLPRAGSGASITGALVRFAANNPSMEERFAWARARTSTAQTAVPILRDLIRIRPLASTYRDRLVQALSDCGLTQEADAACSEAIENGLRPGDFLRHRAALGLARDGPTAQVRQDLIGAGLFGQQRPMLLTLRGDELMKSGRGSQAIEAYSSAKRLDGALPEAWAGLGEALYGAGRLEDARAAFQHARSLQSNDPWILNNLGVVLRDLALLTAAEEAFLTAHQAAPDLFEPVMNLALLYERMGRREEARGWLMKAGSLKPGFPPLEEAWKRNSNPVPP